MLVSSLQHLVEHPGELISIAELLLSSDDREMSVSSLRHLMSDDDRARAQYDQCLQKMHELVLAVNTYKEAVDNRPSCKKERTDAILMELNCEEEQYAKFDMKDESRFPRTIAFIHEMDLWKKRVEKHYKRVKELFDDFIKKIEKMLESAEDTASASHEKKLGTRIVLPVLGVGLGIVGVVLTGGVGLFVAAGAGVGAACGAGVGVIASSEYSKKESTHTELKKKLDELTKEADKLCRFFEEIDKVFVKFDVLDTEDSVILRKMPLSAELKTPFVKIFKLMKVKVDGDIEGIQKKIEKILK